MCTVHLLEPVHHTEVRRGPLYQHTAGFKQRSCNQYVCVCVCVWLWLCPLYIFKQWYWSSSKPHIIPAPPPSHYCVIGLGVYNSAQYYWLQIMINNNNIDKNGTLALTSDLICRPLCTLWCIQYHNHAWVHLAWKMRVKKKKRKEKKKNQLHCAHKQRENITHLQILCWQRANTESQCLLLCWGGHWSTG